MEEKQQTERLHLEHKEGQVEEEVKCCYKIIKCQCSHCVYSTAASVLPSPCSADRGKLDYGSKDEQKRSYIYIRLMSTICSCHGYCCADLFYFIHFLSLNTTLDHNEINSKPVVNVCLCLGTSYDSMLRHYLTQNTLV